MKIVVDENIPFIQNILEPYSKVVYKKGSDITKEDVKDTDALIIRTRTRCDAKLLDGSNIKFIGTATIGYDHIDTEYCRRNGIIYETAAGCNSRAVMQYIASVLVHLSRLQQWVPNEKTIGIIGLGSVGKCVKWFSEKCGFKVLCCDPPEKESDLSLQYIGLDEVLGDADIVTVHVPLTHEGKYPTYKIADRDFFSKMQPGSIFINTSRGEVVHDAALLEYRYKFSAVALDVWNNEPVINPLLAGIVTYGTPHIAGYSLQGKANGTAIIVDKLSRFFGLPFKNWYPDVSCIEPDEGITWEYIVKTIDPYFNIAEQSAQFVSDIGKFEEIRNNYNYRNEYF